MAVEGIEEYRQKNGDNILRVFLAWERNFLVNYFYCDANDEELVKKYNWRLRNKDKPYVMAVDPNRDMQVGYIMFHKVKILGSSGYSFSSDRFFHNNGVAFDNVAKILDKGHDIPYDWYKPSRNYIKYSNDKWFYPYVGTGRSISSAFRVSTEVEANILAHHLELLYHGDYKYNFFKDRCNDLDILNDERTGKISEEEAIYRHVCRYAADNAWYIYRYNLFYYFKENHLSIPAYSLDPDGFMTHPITGQRLCPM